MDLLQFRRQVELGALNTLGLPSIADCLVSIEDVAQLPRLFEAPECKFHRRLILGGGSNLVLTGDFDGLVVQVAICGKQLLGEDKEAWYVSAGAGENWHCFVEWTLARGWPGLENLALIPGTVGAAPIQNIGAYGLEVCERLHCVDVFDLLTGKAACFDRVACRFGYRDSVFKQDGWHLEGRFVVTGVTFRLPKRWEAAIHYRDVKIELDDRGVESPDPRQIADAVIAIRRRKLPDPERLPNSGSFFQNPVVDTQVADGLLARYPALPVYPLGEGRAKLAAGWLIEQAGWKGRDLGKVGMFENQALVLVNRGGACGQDVLALTAAVQRDVKDRFGIKLLPEPVFV